jgi:hypothetical protein
MRRFVLTLMIVLLPLRGWVGDAMAMDFAAGTQDSTVFAIESEAHHAHPAMADAASHAENTMHADCPDHAASPDDTLQAASDCDNCTACQICHAVALTPTLPQLTSAALPAAQPPAAAPLFASAERAPGFKPPIS